MAGEHDYWFPAKRYGWGWGFPTAWQGWVVLGAYIVLLGLAALFFHPHREPLKFVLLVAAASLVFVAVCWLTGEPPRWRWGED
jgi:hypothetical protein